MRMMWSRWWPGRKRPTAGVEVMKERSLNRSAVGACCWNVEAPPGIEWPGGVPSTYPPGARFVEWVGLLTRWATDWSVELQSGQVGSSVNWRSIPLQLAGSIGGGGHKHFVECLGPDGFPYHQASEESSGQGIGALFQQAPEDGGGFGVVTSDSQTSESAVVWGLEGRPGG